MLHDNEKIRRIIQYYCISNVDFANKIGVSRQRVGNMLNADYRIGAKATKQIIAAFPNVNSNWLLFGEGEMFIDPSKEGIEVKAEAREIDPDFMDVELVGKYAYAGYTNGYGDAEYIEMLPKIRVIVDGDPKGNYKCFEVRGDSMFDNSFQSWIDGDIVLCREIQRHLWLPKLHMDQYDFIIVHKDGIVIKRIIEQNNEEGTLTLHSLNPDKSSFPDYKVHMDDIYQIFNVVKLVERQARR